MVRVRMHAAVDGATCFPYCNAHRESRESSCSFHGASFNNCSMNNHVKPKLVHLSQARQGRVPRHGFNTSQATDSPAPAAPPPAAAPVIRWEEPGWNTPGLTQPSSSISKGVLGGLGREQGLDTNPEPDPRRAEVDAPEPGTSRYPGTDATPTKRWTHRHLLHLRQPQHLCERGKSHEGYTSESGLDATVRFFIPRCAR